MDTPQTPRALAGHHAPKARPDARPMRVAFGIGGLATLSALATAIILPPRPPEVQQLQQAAPTDAPTPTDPAPTSMAVQRPIQYVQLSPGETAPPGSTVIKASAPTPLTVVVNITPPPAAKQAAAQQSAPKAPPAPTPIIVKTTQSGKPVP